MEEIRNNKIQLNHVSKSNEGVNLDISNMNKEERNDHVERLRKKLQMRKQALNRR
jgi:ribosome recycling factor